MFSEVVSSCMWHKKWEQRKCKLVPTSHFSFKRKGKYVLSSMLYLIRFRNAIHTIYISLPVASF